MIIIFGDVCGSVNRILLTQNHPSVIVEFDGFYRTVVSYYLIAAVSVNGAILFLTLIERVPLFVFVRELYIFPSDQ